MTPSIDDSLSIIRGWMQTHSPATLAGLNPPASQADLDRVVATTGLRLPDSFADFLRLHDGEAFGNPALLGDFNTLLSCDEIVEEYLLEQEMAASIDDPEFSSIAFWRDRVASRVIFVRGAVKPILSHPAWLPFTRMNGDILRYIDFDPAPTGVPGQIIEVDAEGCTYEVLADSFAAFLADYARRLLAGEFCHDEEYGGVVSRTDKDILQWTMPAWLKNA